MQFNISSDMTKQTTKLMILRLHLKVDEKESCFTFMLPFVVSKLLSVHNCLSVSPTQSQLISFQGVNSEMVNSLLGVP